VVTDAPVYAGRLPWRPGLPGLPTPGCAGAACSVVQPHGACRSTIPSEGWTAQRAPWNRS